MKKIFPQLQSTITRLEREFDQISATRKALISKLASFIELTHDAGKPILLNFICTHNSRRSHIAQIWAEVAAYRYDIKNVSNFSGGTEATAFNSNAVSAMRSAGFKIETRDHNTNPRYEVTYNEDSPPLFVFSKRYDAQPNPTADFAAVMVCSDADDNCPVITGNATRISLPYDDPKAFDGSPLQADKYLERVHDIGREILFAFSMISKKNQ